MERRDDQEIITGRPAHLNQQPATMSRGWPVSKAPAESRQELFSPWWRTTISTKSSRSVWPLSRLGCQPPNTIGNSGRSPRDGATDLDAVDDHRAGEEGDAEGKRQSRISSITVRRKFRSSAPSITRGS